MKKNIFIAITIIIVLCVLVLGYFGIKYLIAPTDIVISINNEILNTEKIDDTLTYNEDIRLSWNNKNFKVTCNGNKVSSNSVITQNGTYNLEFKFKDITKTFKVLINKDLTFKIQDYYGKEIHNYTTNHLPFKIITDDEIKVNNSEFDISNGIYRIGDYKITSKNFDSCIIKINGINDIHEYNFYITYEALPTLYATLDLANTDNKSYIWYGKNDILNSENIKQNQNITVSELSGSPEFLIYSVLDETKSKIKEILENDKNAHFHLYTDDTLHWLEYALFSELGLDSLRYNITYYPSESSKKIEYSYVDFDDYKIFLQKQDEEVKLLNDIKSNKYKNTKEYILDLLPSKTTYLNDYILTSTFRNNITYILEDNSSLQFKDEKINTAIKNNNNIYTQNLYNNFNSLEESKKQKFMSYISISQEELNENYFKNINNDNNDITK